MKTLFIGDINVDVIMGGLQSIPPVDRETICSSYALTAGSSAVISACTYRALGGCSSILGLAGNDENGDFMLREMNRLGLDTALVRRSEEIGTGVTVNLVFGDTRTQVTYPGTIAAFDGSWIDRGILDRFDHAHLAGPYLQTRFRPKIAGVLETCRELGMTTSLDPQWDPAERWEHMDRWLPLLSFLFVNEAEALSLSGGDSIAEALTRLNDVTARPIVKAGARGAFARIGGGVRRIPGFPTELVDTTGAGDTFDAAFLHGTLEQGMSVEEACRFANQVAARSCSFLGGVAGITPQARK